MTVLPHSSRAHRPWIRRSVCNRQCFEGEPRYQWPESSDELPGRPCGLQVAIHGFQNVGLRQNQAGGRALGVTGNAVQSRDGGGLAKAMALLNPLAVQKIVRCYNSQLSGTAASTPPCGLSYSPQALGHYLIDFAFEVDDRFILLSPLFQGPVVSVAVIDPLSVTANQIRVRTKLLDDSDADRGFYIFVF